MCHALLPMVYIRWPRRRQCEQHRWGRRGVARRVWRKGRPADSIAAQEINQQLRGLPLDVGLRSGSDALLLQLPPVLLEMARRDAAVAQALVHVLSACAEHLGSPPP